MHTALAVRREAGRSIETITGPRSAWRFRPHYHAGDEIVRLTAGRARLRLADGTRLVGAGETVVVIEHNLEVIKTADWIIDMGPEGGDGGGEVVGVGTPEDIVKAPRSYTGKFLAPVLRRATPKRKKRVEAAE